MLAGLLATVALMVAPAPLLELDIGPKDGPAPCVPVRIIRVELDGSLLLRGKPVGKSRIVQAMGQVTGEQCERVYIQADNGAPYGAVFGLISSLRAAGLREIALVDRPWEDPAP